MRLPEGLLARVDEARGGLTRTRFMERALESVLCGAEEPSVIPGRSVSAPSRAPLVQRASAMPHRFRCRSCDFTAPSEKARCGRHGGALVPM
jgi:hypothetical protein